MSAIFYILYSPSRDRYYVGQTCSTLEARLQRHNSDHKGFTGKTGDWKIVYHEPYPSKTEAYAREREIKGWKSRVRIESLIRGQLQ